MFVYHHYDDFLSSKIPKIEKYRFYILWGFLSKYSVMLFRDVKL